MQMQGIENSYCDVCIGAAIAAWRTLLEASPMEALNKVKFGSKGEKSDTLGLDAIPEIILSERIKDFDSHALFVTEEIGEATKNRWPTDSDPIRQPLMFFSDPTDRSKFLKIFLERISDGKPTVKIGKLMEKNDCAKDWEEMFESPASITGATSAITCVRKGSIIFSVILNYITQTIYVATPIDVLLLKLPSYDDHNLEKIDLTYIAKHSQQLIFPSAKTICHESDDYKRFVTFLGKTGYTENFNDSMIFFDNPNDYLHHKEPGGPARVLYLSELQKDHGPIGFILANGEKIIEWIHWLAFAKFAKNKKGGQALKVFEISLDRPWTKEGILMSTSTAYSIFFNECNRAFLDISRLKNFKNPSKFRSMLVVTPFDNERIISVMREHNYREVSHFF